MRQLCGGITLIELLIAITLAAGVTVASTLLVRLALEYQNRHTERWAMQADIRHSRRLLQHYWPKLVQDKFMFGSQSLLLYLSERGSAYFIGFACEGMDSGHGNLAFYRWLATSEEVMRIRDGGTWPISARQTLIDDLDQCRFSLMQPPPADDREASPIWVDGWSLRDKPSVLRFDAIGASGWVTPPTIVNATAQ